MTRSALSKKIASHNFKRKEPSPSAEFETSPNQNQQLHQKKKQKVVSVTTTLPNTSSLALRRSERLSSSPSNSASPPPQQKKKPSKAEDEEEEDDDLVEEEASASSDVKIKRRRMNARVYRSVFKTPNKDCNKESNKMDKSTSEAGNNVEGKADEGFEGNLVDCKEVSEDGVTPSEDDKSEGNLVDCREVSEDGIIPLEDDKTEGNLVDCREVSEDCVMPSEDDKTEGNLVNCKEVSEEGIMQSQDAKAEEVRAECRSSENVEEKLENSAAPASRELSNTADTGGENERVQSVCGGEETLEMLESRDSISNKNLIKNYDGHDNGENLISSKRKGAMVNMHSDASAALVNDDNCNLIATGPSSQCGNTVGHRESCSKRIRPISSSDQTKSINNVDQPSPKLEGEKLSTGNKEGKSEDPVERPQSNDDEVRKRQKSLHLLLKPEIAKLCKVLRLPDNVKKMVDNCLEYIMNNRQICTEPVSILQAFQLSLCWIAAALLHHKLDREDSLMLAKRHFNFDCKIEEVNEIHRMMRKLKKDFLYHARNCIVSVSPEASKSPGRVYSNTSVAPKLELPYEDISRSIKGKQLLIQQEEEKKNMTADIKRERADFQIRYRVEWAAYVACSPNDPNDPYDARTEKRKVFDREYNKRIGELDRQHETRLKDLEAKHMEERRKLHESSPLHASLNLVASKKLGFGVGCLRTCDQEQPHNGLVSDLGEGKISNNIVESMAKAGTGVGLSEAPCTNSPVVISCSSQVEQQTQHAGPSETGITASEDEPVSRNKCHDIAKNKHDSQQNITPKHSSCGEQCSSEGTSITDEDKGRENFNHESRDGRGQDTVTAAPFSSNGEICDGGTSDVPGGEVALAVDISSSSIDQDEVPTSRQGKFDGTLLSKPVYGCSVEVELNGFSDGLKNSASLNSVSTEENIPGATTISLPNCENAAQTHEANDCNGLNNVERITSLNSKSPQEHAHSENAKCIPNCENSAQIYEVDDNDGSSTSNIAATLNSTLTEEIIAGGTIVSLSDKEVHAEMPGIVSVSDRELPGPCGTASPSNSADANNITLLNQRSSEEQHPDGATLSTSAGPIPGEVPETRHELVTISVLDREVPVEMPGTFNCANHPENITPLSSSSIGRISDGDSVLDGGLPLRPSEASRPCDGPATVSLLSAPCLEQQIPDRVSLSISDGQILVIVPETSHKMAECPLTDSAVVDKSTRSDHLEGVHTTMTVEDTLSQEAAGSTSVDLMESQEGVHKTMTGNTSSQEAAGSRAVVLIGPLEQVQPLSFDDSPPDQGTDREMLNFSRSSLVDIMPANQSIHVSPVMEPPEDLQQQSPSAEFLSFNHDLSNLPLATGTQNQPTNEDALSSPVLETSVEMPNQSLEQPASHLEPDSPMPDGVRTQSADARTEHQPTNEGALPSPITETSIEVPNQAVEQPASNLELDSPMPGGVRTWSSDTRNEHQPTNRDALSSPITETSIEVLNQAFEQPASNLELDSPLPGGVRTQSSDTRNFSTPSEIYNHPIQTAAQLASRIVSPLCDDPLVYELERLRKLTEENMKSHEDKKSQLKSDYEKELEELHRKYGIKLQEMEFGFQQTRKNLDTHRKTVVLNKILAEAFRFKCTELRLSGAHEVLQDASFTQQLLQLSRQQTALRPPLVCGPSSRGPPAASLQSSYATSSSQNMVSPIQAAYNTSGIFSSISPRPPNFNSMPSRSVNPQAGGEMRAPAPHLQPYRPSTSVPAPNISTIQLRMPSPATYQSDPHRGHRPVAVSQSGINMQNILQPFMASLNPSRLGTNSSMPANPAHRSTSDDVVCLSDDD